MSTSCNVDLDLTDSISMSKLIEEWCQMLKRDAPIPLEINTSILENLGFYDIVLHPNGQIDASLNNVRYTNIRDPQLSNEGFDVPKDSKDPIDVTLTFFCGNYDGKI